MAQKRFYSSNEAVDIILEDIPLGDTSDLSDSDSDSEDDYSPLVDRIQTEQMETTNPREILEDISQSEINDDDVDNTEVMAVDDVASSSDSDEVPNLDDNGYDVDQDRQWQKVAKDELVANFNQPEGM